MADQGGQATVEWVGLVLVAALVLGALAAFRGPAGEPGLGRAVAGRITCVAGGKCGGAAARPVRSARLVPVNRARAVDAFRSLRGVGTVAKRLWVVCLGYRRFRYEMEHPRAPTEPMPLAEAADIANTCLNPASFLTGD